MAQPSRSMIDPGTPRTRIVLVGPSSGRAGSGRAGPGRVGPGRVGPGRGTEPPPTNDRGPALISEAAPAGGASRPEVAGRAGGGSKPGVGQENRAIRAASVRMAHAPREPRTERSRE